MPARYARRPQERHHPAEALELLRDPERIRFACNPFENPRWWHADARTRGADGVRTADAFAARDALDAHARELARVAGFTIAELTDFVRRDRRMLLLEKDVSRDEPWDVPTGKMRPIVVPTVLRRCISNLVAEVLDVTCDHLLPASAVAYRPGHVDAVAETLVDVASDIHFGGKTFYWKFDLKNAFPSLPWPGVAASLSAIGYPTAFVEFVMRLLMAPIAREVKGHRILVPTDRGCPAGLPESAILLNIFLKPLDEAIGDQFPQVTYRRYSDDGVLVGAQRHMVVGAVRRVVGWARGRGVQLKGVHADQSPASLVRDVRDTAVPLLGAAIQADGDLRIPAEKIERQLGKLRFMLERTPEVSGRFAVAAGVSQYATGGHARGRRTYDREDFQRCFEQFFSYAFALNEGDAMNFLDRVRRELGVNPQLPPDSYSELVWVAALGEPGAVQAGGLRNLHRTHPESLKAWFLYTLAQKDDDPIDLDEVDGSLCGCASEEVFGTSAHLEEEEVGVPIDLESWVADGGDDRVVGDRLLAEEDESVALSLGLGSRERVDGWSSLWTAGEDVSSDEEASSTSMSETERSVRSVRFKPVTPVCSSSGAVELAQEPEPPGPCDHDNALVVHVVAHRVARRHPDGGTVVGVQQLGSRTSQPQIEYFQRKHEAAALIEMVGRLREDALRAGHGALLVLLDDADLPKALLQRERAFRQPALFRAVLDLHLPHPVPVVIAGPWAPPPALAARVRDAQGVRGRALRKAHRAP